MEDPRQLTSILGALLGEGVEFVLVGALAAVAQGAPLTIGLETIVALKRKSGTPKDRLALPVLEETLKRRRG